MNRCLLLFAGALAAGCTATKSTVYLAKAEQALIVARQAEAPEWAPYPWTQADAFIKKAREEWGYSDFGAAESLSLKSQEWANKAVEEARQNKATNTVPGTPPERAKNAVPRTGPWRSATGDEPAEAK